MEHIPEDDYGYSTPLHAALRLSSIYLEMLLLAAALEPQQAKIVLYSANVLGLLRRYPIRADAAEVIGLWSCHGKPGPPGRTSGDTS